QWGRISRRQFGRHPRYRARRGDQVLGVAAIISEPRYLAGHAGKELTPAAVTAVSAIAPVPADADPLTRLPVSDSVADRINHPAHLMTGDAGVLKSWIISFLDERIAVADAASEDPDPDRSGARLGYRPINDFERSLWARHLSHTHRSHEIPPEGRSFRHGE